jgi:hypothetical protein
MLMTDHRHVVNAERKPLFLLADSQPLFRSESGTLLPALQQSLMISERSITRAAYIGASNGDAPEFFDRIFDGIHVVKFS